MQQKKIRVSLSDSNRPHVEGVRDYETSVFKGQYDLCFGMLDSILAANRDIREEDRSECNNNIIVFDGERGSGKTSCLLSVARMLTEEDDRSRSFFENMPYECLKEYRFWGLPILEPSFFDKEHNAVTLFVSRLYKAYLDLDGCKDDKRLKMDLLKQFVVVQQSIKCIFGDFDPKDGLEYLVELSSAIDLRSALAKLVRLFLEYSEKENHKMLILIDDIDINPEMADDMVEQVRKYLVLPGVIVLVSMKIKQLNGILSRQYAREYDRPLQTEDRKDINNRVEKYLTKLFPRNQRVYMPVPEVILNYPLEVVTGGIWKYELPVDLLVRQVIPELIFKKTRYLFYNTKKRESYIVPRNLRDLRQLLQLLIPMPDYSNEDESVVHPENKLSFRKYFFEDWTANNLTEKQRAVAQCLIDVEQFEELNYKTVALLYRLIENLDAISNGNRELSDVVYPLNNMLNVSLGDVLALIRVLETAAPDEENRRFFFFVRSLYSIRLYEAYDSITMSRESIRMISSPTTINRDLHRMVKNDYEAIVAGTVYNTELFDFLPKESGTIRISSRNISRNSVINLAKLCVEKWDSVDRDIYVELLELIMLSVYYDDTLWKETQNLFRKSDSICYQQLNVGCKDFRFDIGALIFNLSRPLEAIMRFRVFEGMSDFFERYMVLGPRGILMRDLYDMMLVKKFRVKEYKSENEKWLSFCCFRNVEILEDFLDYIRERMSGYVRRIRRNLSESTWSADVIEAFFDVAADYSIQSYDRFNTSRDREENNAYRIHFSFYEVIASRFRNRTFKKEFAKIFDSAEYSWDVQNESAPF